MPTPLDRIATANLPVLISFVVCPFVQRAAILLNVKKQPFERINIDLNNKPEWFLRQVPTGKVPALVVNEPEPTWIFESAIINEYLDEQYGERLLPKEPLKRAQQRAQISLAEGLIMAQYMLFSAQTTEDYQARLVQFVDRLSQLAPNDNSGYFDRSFGLVDAAIAPVFTRLKWIPEALDHIADKQALNHWITTLLARDEVINSVAADFEQQFEQLFSERGSFALKQYAFNLGNALRLPNRNGGVEHV